LTGKVVARKSGCPKIWLTESWLAESLVDLTLWITERMVVITVWAATFWISNGLVAVLLTHRLYSYTAN
jgi:hypothetical protein